MNNHDHMRINIFFYLIDEYVVDGNDGFLEKFKKELMRGRMILIMNIRNGCLFHDFDHES